VTTAARRAGQRQHAVSADCGLRGNTFADAVSWVLIAVDAADQN
jgi:hypothetical protein